MTEAEFRAKLKDTQFRKATSANGARGYSVTVQRDGKDYGLTVFAGPDQATKLAYKLAYNKLVAALAKEWGYKGSLEKFH